VVEHRAGWLDPVFIALSVIGYAGLVWIALAVLIAVLARLPLLTTTALAAVCVWGADLLTMGLKPVIDRPRPFETLPEVDPLLGGTLGSSLPSGHAATSFAGAVVLGSLYRRGLPAFILLAVAIAYSRVYLGVHYPADVVGGLLLGRAVADLWSAGVSPRTTRVEPAAPTPLG
jgi:undecaprenyl-diphosphatase